MKLVRGAVGVATFIVGLLLLLRLLGVLATAIHDLRQWWPAVLMLAGIAILTRAKPRAVVVTSLGLICLSLLFFATTRGILTAHIWAMAAAVALILAGVILVSVSIANPPNLNSGAEQRIFVSLRRDEKVPSSKELTHIRAIVFAGHLDLYLTKIVDPGQLRSPLFVDVTAWFGTVKVIVLSGVPYVDYRAFPPRMGPLGYKLLTEHDVQSANIVVASLTFLGEVSVTTQERTTGSDVADTGAAHHRAFPPAMQ